MSDRRTLRGVIAPQHSLIRERVCCSFNTYPHRMRYRQTGGCQPGYVDRSESTGNSNCAAVPSSHILRAQFMNSFVHIPIMVRICITDESRTVLSTTLM